MSAWVELRRSPPDAVSRRALALGAKGFRPFFLLAALFAAVAVPLWVAIYLGMMPAGTYLEPVAWHAHEMVFGFAVAVIAGFLLTAAGNWTQRETAAGAPLYALALLWLAGRLAVTFASALPRGAAAGIDLAFLPALLIAVGRPIVAARNARNLVMLAVLGTLWLANLAVHLDALGRLRGWQMRGCMVGVDVVVVLLVIMIGRVLPMFTRNATGSTTVRQHPALDRLAVGATALVAVLDAAAPHRAAGAIVATTAGVLVAARAIHWGFRAALRHPLLWILHFGQAWLASGLVLRGLSAAGLVAEPLATHALTAGAMGSLTLGMMARVALGHTGRKLAPSRWMIAAFALVTLAASARVAGPLVWMARYVSWLELASVAWSAAFVIYLVVCTPILLHRRIDGKRG